MKKKNWKEKLFLKTKKKIKIKKNIFELILKINFFVVISSNYLLGLVLLYNYSISLDPECWSDIRIGERSCQSKELLDWFNPFIRNWIHPVHFFYRNKQEAGNHETLLEKRGIYYHLVQSQQVNSNENSKTSHGTDVVPAGNTENVWLLGQPFFYFKNWKFWLFFYLTKFKIWPKKIQNFWQKLKNNKF